MNEDRSEIHVKSEQHSDDHFNQNENVEVYHFDDFLGCDTHRMGILVHFDIQLHDKWRHR